MRRNRRTKLIATLGPASQDDAVVRKLFEAGADVFRINMSHSSHQVLNERVAQLRRIEVELGRPIGILADLQGPKLRVGTFAAPPVMLEKGQSFVLDADPTPGDAKRVHLPHPEILQALRPGHRVLIDDGKMLFVVTEATPTRVVISVEVPGAISNKKGVSLPDTLLPSSADRQGPVGSCRRAGGGRRLDRAQLRSASRGCCGGPQDRARAGAGDVQAREAAGDRAAGRDHGTLGRANGGARRSRC